METALNTVKSRSYNRSYSPQRQYKGNVCFRSDQNDQSARWFIDNLGYTVITAISTSIGAFVNKSLYKKMVEQGDSLELKQKIPAQIDEMIKHFKLNEDCTVTAHVDRSLDELFGRFSSINAFYNPSTKEAFAPREMPSLIFHELGHAVIDCKTKFLRFLQNHSEFGKKVLPWAWLALPFIDDIARQEKSMDKDSTFSKMVSFIHNHVGSIVFLTFIPQLISEAMASHYGIRFAKIAEKAGELAKKDVNLLKTRYKWAFGTYFTAAVVAALTIKAYEVFRDKLFGYSQKKQGDF